VDNRVIASNEVSREAPLSACLLAPLRAVVAIGEIDTSLNFGIAVFLVATVAKLPCLSP